MAEKYRQKRASATGAVHSLWMMSAICEFTHLSHIFMGLLIFVNCE